MELSIRECFDPRNARYWADCRTRRAELEVLYGIRYDAYQRRAYDQAHHLNESVQSLREFRDWISTGESAIHRKRTA